MKTPTNLEIESLAVDILEKMDFIDREQYILNDLTSLMVEDPEMFYIFLENNK